MAEDATRPVSQTSHPCREGGGDGGQRQQQKLIIECEPLLLGPSFFPSPIYSTVLISIAKHTLFNLFHSLARRPSVDAGHLLHHFPIPPISLVFLFNLVLTAYDAERSLFCLYTRKIQ